MKTMKTMKKGAAILIATLVFGLSLAMFGFTSGLVKPHSQPTGQTSK